MPVTVGQVIKMMDELAPPGLAEDWDNVGLQVGDVNQQAGRILVALDVDERVIEEAVALKADLIVSHHPLIFQPVKNLSFHHPLGKLVRQLIKHDLSLFSAHTNLDSAQGGINDVLAELFQLHHIEVLAPAQEEKFFKLVVFVPAGYLDQVRQAICAAGAGWIGNYSHCTFSVLGQGTFLPLEGTNPFLGEPGKLERADEYRLETIVPEHRLNSVRRAMIKSHPYEEVAYDVYPTALEKTKQGLGRIGDLSEPMELSWLTRKVKEVLAVDVVKVIGHPEQRISRIALCGGAGMSFLHQAKKKGAQCFITGDLKYHEGQNAVAMGMAVIDAGHYATEVVIVSRLVSRLKKTFTTRNWEIDVVESKVNTNPWSYY
ncbi:Nif3-like dinuclear metal center hexameric protein [Candidatus Formimonas warabiya]|uniref:GTP cyclohydrolase 1 type 2 homolog n=1 Tax=Formimonas warabiya TaxID=1761012 RepID=A0A3G1KZ65_FORW1|nr:Nif3-like dinuclear metal center hexameric protein [Candidatus Formimonas warabiya]ATW27659.1 Nif3-like dinuclear metal center hexameric protein [Candidatus Formimonas warabiya]